MRIFNYSLRSNEVDSDFDVLRVRVACAVVAGYGSGSKKYLQNERKPARKRSGAQGENPIVKKPLNAEFLNVSISNRQTVYLTCDNNRREHTREDTDTKRYRKPFNRTRPEMIENECGKESRKIGI